MSGMHATNFPNAGANSASTNADNVRANEQWIEITLIFAGQHPDFDGAISYTGAGLVDVVTWTEQTAAATDDGRALGTRKIARATHSYTAGQLVKIRREISLNNGSTWNDWVGRAGNGFSNYGYTAGNVTSITRATS